MLAQAARNVRGHMARQENEMQGLVYLHTLAAKYEKLGKTPNWVDIKRLVLKTHPPYATYVESLISFVAAKAGGQDGEHLLHLQAVWRLWVNPNLRVSLPPAVYEALADCDSFLLALALWQAAYVCPPQDVKAGVCMWLRAMDVVGLKRSGTALHARAVEAETFLGQVRAALRATSLPHPPRQSNTLVKELSRFEIHIARWVLGRQEKSKDAFPDLAAIGRDFLARLGAVAEFRDSDLDALARVCPAEPTRPAAPTIITAAEAHQITLTAVGLDGTVLGVRARLRAKGFDLDHMVRNAEGHVGTIVGVCEANAEVTVERKGATSHGDWQSKVVPIADFLAGWEAVDPASIREEHPGWPLKRWPKAPAAEPLMAKARILMAIGQLSEALDTATKPEEKLVVLTKPRRCVEAKEDLPVGSVILVPETSNIYAARAGAPEPALGAVPVELQPGPTEWTFYLQPAAGTEAMSPYWYVASTADERACNMVPAKYLMTLMWAHDYVGDVPLAHEAAVQTPLRRKSKKNTPGGGDTDMEEAFVILPVLVNSRPIPKGSELVMFRAAAPKKVREAGAITVSQLLKRARAV